MHYREHNDGGVLNVVINTEWKSMNQCSPRGSVNDRVSGWSFRDRGECNQHLIEELVSELGQLLLIPNRRIR